MSEWQEVPQDYRKQQQLEASTVQLHLSPMGGNAAISNLVVTIPPGLATWLGWTIGMELGLAIGSGQTAGLIRVAPTPRPGRQLCRVSGHWSLAVSLQGPDAWRGLRMWAFAAEYRIKGDALLVKIPWDMDNIEPADVAADKVAWTCGSCRFWAGRPDGLHHKRGSPFPCRLPPMTNTPAHGWCGEWRAVDGGPADA